MNWNAIKDWLLGLGADYGVNPFIFGSIYIGSIPSFLLSTAWLIRNYRQGKSIVLPAISTTLSLISPYVYLVIAGKNVPLWIYGTVILFVVIGAFSTLKKVRRKIKAEIGHEG